MSMNSAAGKRSRPTLRVPSRVDVTDSSNLERLTREMTEHANDLSSSVDQLSSDVQTIAAKPPDTAAIRSGLSKSGNHPLNVEGLMGVLATPQTAGKVAVASATGPGPYPMSRSEGNYVHVSTLPFTVKLIPKPEKGDMAIIHDDNGGAGASSITIDGNGNKINGSATSAINVNNGTAILVFNGTQWNRLKVT